MSSAIQTYTLRVLHISDLHIGQPGVEHDWRRRRVLGDAWEKNLGDIRASGRPVDLLCFTGDVVYNGKDHYEDATAFVQDILGRLNLSSDRFFAVPGNHDVDRNANQSAWKKFRAMLPDLEPLQLSTWLTGGKAPRGFEPDTLNKVLERSAAFWQWLCNDMGRAALHPAGSPHQRLGYRHILDLPGWPFPVHIIGLDTAWLAGDENDMGRLRLTDGQIGLLADDRLEGFKLALAHHPLDFLADKKDSRRLLAERVDLVLQGHLHEADTELWSDPDRALRENTAGCLYEHDRWPNAMQVIDITFSAAGPPLCFELWVRSWSERSSSWFDDNGLFKGTKDGRLTRFTRLGEENRQHNAARENLERGLAACQGRVFVERQAEMDAIVATLLNGAGTHGCCAITTVEGMPGVGKSYLASEFLLRYGDRFPGGVWPLILARDDPRDARALALDLCEQLKVRTGGEAPWLPLNNHLACTAPLILIENVDTAMQAREVAALAGHLDACPILITGRYQKIGDGGRWRCVPLKPFAHGEAFDQLVQELGNDAPHRADDLHHLVDTLGCLPLAIHIAAGRLRQPGMTVKAFLQMLRNKGLDVAHPVPADRILSRDQAEQTIRAALETGLDALRKMLEDEGEAALFDAFACLGHAPRSGFGHSLGAALCGLEEYPFTTLAVAACRLSLLQSETLPSVVAGGAPRAVFRVHPLLAELLAARCDAGEPAARITDWFVERMQEQERWNEIHEEHAALAAWLWRMAQETRNGTLSGEMIRRIALVGSRFAILCGPFNLWAAFCSAALEQEVDGQVRSNVLWTLGNVSKIAGNLNQAIKTAQEKYELDKSQGAEREAVLAAGLLANILEQRGEATEALRIRREEELPVYERLGDVRAKAVTMGKIADILQQRGETDESLRIRREEELPVYERLGDVRERAVTMAKIADILRQRGETDEALRMFREEVLPAFERLGDVRSKAATMGRIADILQQRGETDEAQRIHREEALPVFERLGDVRSKAMTMAKIADILRQRGETEGALRVFREEVLPVFERLGDMRSKAVTMGRIADILEQRGETDEALHIYREEELPVYERLGDVREKAMTMGKIADILQQRGETDEALRIHREEGLPVYERLGDVREKTVTLGKIADILHQRGETDEALRIHIEECLPMAVRMEDMEGVAHIRFSCAQIRLARGGWKKGEAQTISDELAESFALNQQLQRTDGIAFVGKLYGQVLATAGQCDKAVQVLDLSAASFDKLGETERAAAVRALQAQIRCKAQ